MDNTRLYILEYPDMFDSRSTGISFYDDVINDPDYMEKVKGVVGDVVYMPPKEYLKKSKRGFRANHRLSGRADPFDYNLKNILNTKNLQQYIRDVGGGSRFPMPYLDYRNMTFNQEGRHRAMVAWHYRISKIPVLVVRDA